MRVRRVLVTFKFYAQLEYWSFPMPAGIASLPEDVLSCILLPLLSAQDIAQLATTNRQFNTLCEDPFIWKTRFKEDFSWKDQSISQDTDWKTLYKRLAYPGVFGWGWDLFIQSWPLTGLFTLYDRDNRGDRLGSVPLPHSVHIGIPNPVKLDFPAKRFTALAAGGWYGLHWITDHILTLRKVYWRFDFNWWTVCLRLVPRSNEIVELRLNMLIL